MLSIRRDQMQQLAARGRARFEARAVEHMRRCFPDPYAAIAPERLALGVQEAARRAAHHGITGQRDVIRFIDCMVVLGGRFDEQDAAARDILSNTRIAATHRMDALWRHLRERLRGAARE